MFTVWSSATMGLPSGLCPLAKGGPYSATDNRTEWTAPPATTVEIDVALRASYHLQSASGDLEFAVVGQASSLLIGHTLTVSGPRCYLDTPSDSLLPDLGAGGTVSHVVRVYNGGSDDAQLFIFARETSAGAVGVSLSCRVDDRRRGAVHGFNGRSSLARPP